MAVIKRTTSDNMETQGTSAYYEWTCQYSIRKNSKGVRKNSKGHSSPKLKTELPFDPYVPTLER